MSNSPMVSYVKISPNRTSPRRDEIRKITIHHVAGNLSIEAMGSLFASGAREASANYGVGTDGRVGMYVEEKDRAWTSSSPSNDNQAITIEVANDGGEPNWHVSDKALEATIALCVDICKRNGIEKLIYTGDASGNLTRHNMFAATACPGPYLQSKFPYIADEVNKRLDAKEPEDEDMTYEQFEKYMDRYLNIGGTGDEHSSWASEALEVVKSNGIFNGDGEGSYGWKKPITREAVAQVIFNLLIELSGLPEDEFDE
jgi:hypothetical protein